MQAAQRTIEGVLTEQLCYEIPPYQRPYSWAPDHARDLLDDINEACEANDPEYFIGSIITIEREADALYEVVDGQQRLTTLNIILARLAAAVQPGKLRDSLRDRVQPRDPYTDQVSKPRLTLRKRDRAFFRDHVLGGELLKQPAETLDPPKARLVANMAVADAFFAGRTQEWLQDFAKYLMRNVYVVVVTTGSLQSAFRLFNVLNDRGLGLSNADLIKNKLFDRLSDSSLQEELEDLWVELEDVADVDDLDKFLGYHRTTINAEKSRKSLADEFESILAAYKGSSIEFLKGLIDSARNYQRIVTGDLSDVKANRPLAALRRVTYDEWVPALLAFLNKPVARMAASEFVGSLERITMQNWVRRLGRTARNTAYYRLISAINAAEDAERVRRVFRESANNEEFFSLLGGTLYGSPAAQAVLLRLEEGDLDESVTKSFAGSITIEHVLPQSLKEEYWQSRFSEASHLEWLHRLGNLTLLSGTKNSAASCYAFPKKKEFYLKRNQKVSFDLTKSVCEKDEWTPEVIAERHASLMSVAEHLWRID